MKFQTDNACCWDKSIRYIRGNHVKVQTISRAAAHRHHIETMNCRPLAREKHDS